MHRKAYIAILNIAVIAYLSALVCDQSSKRFSIEPTEAEAKTAIHTVSSQLQSLLANVILRGKKNLLMKKMYT